MKLPRSMRRLAAAVLAVLAVIIADESEPNLAHTDVKLDPDPSFPTLTLRFLLPNLPLY